MFEICPQRNRILKKILRQPEDIKGGDGCNNHSTTMNARMNFLILDSMIESDKERMTPTKDIKEIKIDP